VKLGRLWVIEFFNQGGWTAVPQLCYRRRSEAWAKLRELASHYKRGSYRAVAYEAAS
jgi:hypothetical protein